MAANADNVKEITTILRDLKQNEGDTAARGEAERSSLERLKVLGRQPADSAEIFEEDSIRLLADYGLSGSADEVSREALRCLANALFLNADSRKTFATLEYTTKLVSRLRHGNVDDEFLCCRILFLLTYADGLDYEKLTKEEQLDEILCERLQAQAKASEASSGSAIRIMALTDMLKLLYNITHFEPALMPRFDLAVQPIFALLASEASNVSCPLDQPIASLINALLNLDLGGKVDDAASKMHKVDVERLITILAASLTSYTELELDESLPPLITLLRKIIATANPQIKSLMKTSLLPTDAERDKPLGQSETTFAKLIRLSNNAMTPNLRDPISRLFFELSGSDATTFVRNVGLGYASGFMSNNGISTPASLSGGGSTNDGNDARDINPVTGQFTDKEPANELPPMTEEEKEREAERLFVLFERLKATGVVDVQNPIETAMRAGRFEELPDDE